MASPRPRRRRLLLPTILAAVLAGEITGIAIGRSLTPSTPVAADPAAPRAAATAVLDRATEVERPSAREAAAEVVHAGVDLASRQLRESGRAPLAEPTTPVRAGHASTRPASGTVRAAAPVSYHGTNHVWIPSLGINRPVQSFPCSRTRPPDAGVYRWGCAGRNNVYLLSHAWSTFKPLHDAYVRGTLRKGMKVIYADGSSRVHTYRVIWWRVTAPTTAASWAWASLSSPGMTLQTCVGANSEYRLMVRLDQVA
jgi:sortase family protein